MNKVQKLRELEIEADKLSEELKLTKVQNINAHFFISSNDYTPKLSVTIEDETKCKTITLSMHQAKELAYFIINNLDFKHIDEHSGIELEPVNIKGN